MANFLFPVVNNKQKDATVGFEDFKPLVPKKERKRADLTFKNGKFNIAPEFTKDRTENTGFVAVIDPDNNKGYFLRSTTPEAFANTTSVKGLKGARTFTSDTLEFIASSQDVDLTKDIYLNFVRSEGGFDVFDISNTSIDEPQPATPVEVDSTVNNGVAPLDPQSEIIAPPVEAPAQQDQFIDPAIVADDSSLTNLL